MSGENARTMSKPVLQVSGPPGSGKSRFLAREAIRLHVQEGVPLSRLLILAVSAQNQARLRHYLKLESTLAGLASNSLAVTTLDQWLLGLLNAHQPEGSQWQLLTALEGQAILAQAIQTIISPEHPLFSASQDASFTHLIANLIRQCQLQGLPSLEMASSQAASLLSSNLSTEDSVRLALLDAIYQQFTNHCQNARLLTYPALTQAVSALLEKTGDIFWKSSCESSGATVLLLDEAQELSASQYQLLSQFPGDLVLAGNDKLGIRSYRGAQPDLFRRFFAEQQRPITHQVQQACLRSNTASLSLLSALLPEPIWEEQSPDLEALKKLVQFGYYTDAVAEAQALAQQIADFVAHQRVKPTDSEGQTEGQDDDRPATYADCVVLLRSARYKSSLRDAFLKQGIPFQDDSLSEAVLDFQRDFYALLQVLAFWQQWGFLPGHFESPDTLEALAQKAVASLPEWEASLKAHNRYLLRWLEAVLQETPQSAILATLKVASNVTEPDWQLGRWLNPQSAPPALVQAIQQVIGIYQCWGQQTDAGLLLDAALQALSPVMVPADDSPEGVLTEALGPVRKAMDQLSHRFHQATGQPLTLKHLLAQFDWLWQTTPAFSKPNQVRLLSIHQVQGEAFPFVTMPFLISDEFPSQREHAEWLSEQALLALGLSPGFSEAEERRLFAVGVSRATQRLLLTCHQQTGTERVLPSPYYTALLAQKRQLLQCPSAALVCACESEISAVRVCEVDFCDQPGSLKALPNEAALESELPELQADFQSNSAWAQLHPQAPEPVFEAEAVLPISPTAMTRYIQCPRQYYYKHLLGLKEPGSVAASLGTLIHKVMEAFNSQTPPGEHTPQRLREVAEAFFGFEREPQAFYMAGFGERERQELTQMSPLAVHALQTSLLASIEDLTEKGYFDRYGTLKAVYAERELKDIALVGLERCRLNGKMDAVIQLADGRWEVVDYKTYGPSKYGTRLELCEQKFQNTLEALPDDADLGHAERFAPKWQSSYPIDYQLPLYYWACQQDSALKEGMAGVSLQLVRPRFPDNPSQGAIRLGLSQADLDTHRQRVLQDIQNCVVDPILNSDHFPPVPESGACDYCAYAGICEQGTRLDEEGPVA